MSYFSVNNAPRFGNVPRFGMALCYKGSKELNQIQSDSQKTQAELQNFVREAVKKLDTQIRNFFRNPSPEEMNNAQKSVVLNDLLIQEAELEYLVRKNKVFSEEEYNMLIEAEESSPANVASHAQHWVKKILGYGDAENILEAHRDKKQYPEELKPSFQELLEQRARKDADTKKSRFVNSIPSSIKKLFPPELFSSEKEQ